MDKLVRVIMLLGIFALLFGAMANALVGLSSFWHGIGWGMSLVIAPLLLIDMIKHQDDYFG